VTTFFLACAAVGALVLVAQLVLGAFGIDGGHHDASGVHLGHTEAGHTEAGHTSDALQLLGVRPLAAGALFFGIAGFAALAARLPGWAALGIGAGAGLAAATSVAALMRTLLRLEDDGTLQIGGAVGLPATVYLRVPGGRQGVGKVLLTLQNRIVEYQAVTSHASPHDIPTGAKVIVVDVVGPDTVEVAPTPSDGEIFDVTH